MRVQVHGPNLRNQDHGVFEVHAAGCRDAGRNGGEHGTLIEEYATLRELVEDYYGDQIAESNDTWLGYVDDFHVFPCAAELHNGG